MPKRSRLRSLPLAAVLIFILVVSVSTVIAEEQGETAGGKEKAGELGKEALGTAPAPAKEGSVYLEVTGTGSTTGLVFNLINKTDQHQVVIIPTGTPFTSTLSDCSSYQTGRIPPMVVEPGETLTREFPAYSVDRNLAPAPTAASVRYAPHTGPLSPQQELIRELIVVADTLQDLHTACGKVVEPGDLIGLTPATGAGHAPPDWPRRDAMLLGWLQLWEDDVWSYDVPGNLGFDLSSLLNIPSTVTFVMPEAQRLKANLFSRDGKGEAALIKPTGEMEVELAPTDDPEVAGFNIVKFKVYAGSTEVLGESGEDIIVTLNSPEEGTGLLNMTTGDVKGAVSLKAWGEDYDKPLITTAAYTGRLDFSTKKLSLNMNGISFEPVGLEKGLYQLMMPEKFWDAVHLYAIWDETNDAGKKELREIMTEQLRTKFPEERAEELADMVTKEIIEMADEIQDLQEDLKDDGFDFSRLDPSLKLREL